MNERRELWWERGGEKPNFLDTWKQETFISIAPLNLRPWEGISKRGGWLDLGQTHNQTGIGLSESQSSLAGRDSAAAAQWMMIWAKRIGNWWREGPGRAENQEQQTNTWTRIKTCLPLLLWWVGTWDERGRQREEGEEGIRRRFYNNTVIIVVKNMQVKGAAGYHRAGRVNASVCCWCRRLFLG